MFFFYLKIYVIHFLLLIYAFNIDDVFTVTLSFHGL